MRRRYQIQGQLERMARLDDPYVTAWTTQQKQANGQVSALCPRGRVGTYNYRLSVKVDIDGITVGDSPAADAPVRTDRRTGTS